MPRTVPIGGARSGRAVFRRGSNVLEYWLDHAEGFEIRYRRRSRGHVESLLVDSHSGRTEGLVVRSPMIRRTRVIPAESIVAVEPFERVLMPRLESSPLVRTGRATKRSAVGLGGAGWRGALWLGPRVRHAAAAAGRGGRRAGAYMVGAAAWLSPRAWTATKTASTRSAAAVHSAGRQVAESSGTAWAWGHPRLSSLARASATGARSGARRLAQETRAALTRARPHLSAAAAWLGPRLKASLDAAGTGTPSVWHLPHPAPPRVASSDSPGPRDVPHDPPS
jgi:hypothetical protein